MMILTTAYCLLLAFSLNPANHSVVTDQVLRPTQPVSLAVGDSLGLACLETHHDAVPLEVAAHWTATQSPAAWTQMPTSLQTHWVSGH